jgi:hypothetical protein
MFGSMLLYTSAFSPEISPFSFELWVSTPAMQVAEGAFGTLTEILRVAMGRLFFRWGWSW